MTPYEALYGVKPYLVHIRVLGCLAYAHIPDKKRKKFDSHSRECMLMGYYDTDNMFYLFDINGNAMIKCRDAIFFEDVLRHANLASGGLPVSRTILGDTMDPPNAGELDDAESVELNDDHQHSITLTLHALMSRNSLSLPPNVHTVISGVSPLFSPHLVCMAASDVPPVANSSTHLLKFDFTIPRTYRAAMSSPQAPYWTAACDDEYNTLLANHTWTLVTPSPESLVIGNKWVFAIK